MATPEGDWILPAPAKGWNRTTLLERFDRARMNAEERLQAAFGAELERTGVTDPYELPDEWIATTQGRLLKEECEQATQATYRDWFDAEIEFRPRRAAEDVEGVGEPAATGREPSVRDAAPDVEGGGHRGVAEVAGVQRDFAGRVTEPLGLSFEKGSGEGGGWNVVSLFDHVKHHRVTLKPGQREASWGEIMDSDLTVTNLKVLWEKSSGRPAYLVEDHE